MYNYNDFPSTAEDLRQEFLEFKKQEAKLKQSVDILRSTLECTAYGVIAVNIQGEILTCNQKFINLWQIPATVAKSILFSDYQAFIQQQVEDIEIYCRTMGQLSLESDLETYDILSLKNGRVLALYSQPHYLDKSIIGRVWSTWDITLPNRWHTLVETSNASIFVIENSVLRYMNLAGEKLTGYTREELGNVCNANQLFYQQKFEQPHHQNQGLGYSEVKIVTKNAGERWLACVVVSLNSNPKSMQAIIAIDISDYKQSQSELEQKLEKFKRLSELRRHFMSMICHEFRNPLNVVAFSNSLLRKYINDWKENKTEILIDNIQSSVTQINRMLDDIMLFSQVEAAKLNFDAKPLNLIDFCHNLIAEIQINHSQNRINFFSESTGLVACIDKKILEPILRNLLDNAIKYSLPDELVDLRVFRASGMVVFQIIDRGIGIPICDRKRIFEPFYRGSNITNLPGNGLGLSIVKTFVELYGGSITVDSELCLGTTFTIMLPVLQCNNFSIN